MVALLQPFTKYRVFDVNGDPGAFYKLNTFLAGTVSTPKATFQDFAGLVANTNPVVFNSVGEADIRFATDELYKLELLDDLDNLQWTVDNYGSAETGIATGYEVLRTVQRLTSIAGQPTMTAAAAAPAGSIVVGAVIFIETTFGSGQGLTGINVGVDGAYNRYGTNIPLTAGTKTNAGGYTNYVRQPTTVPFDIIVSTAGGGPFDGTGSLLLTTFYELHTAAENL